MSPNPFRKNLFPLLLAAAMLGGCASSERMMRLSPLSDEGFAPDRVPVASRVGRLAAPRLSDDRVNAFPFYYYSGGMTSVLWPLADWDDRGFAFRPFYNRDGENRSVLFPLSGWDDHGGWALNAVWDERKGWMVAPFFGSWNDTDFVLPVFVTRRPSGGTVTRVFPVWYSDDAEWRLDPLVSRLRRADGGVERTALLGAGWWRSESADGNRLEQWIFPLGWNERDGGDWRWLTLPVSAGREGDAAWFNLHPLWWSSSRPGYARETLFPLWWRRAEGRRDTVWTPAGLFRRDGDNHENLTWLYGEGCEGNKTWFNVHPFWWSSRDEAGESRLLFPLWWRRVAGDLTETWTPLGMSARDGENSRRTLTWLYGEGRRGDERWLNIHPLWWSSESPRESFSALAPLWLRHTTPSGETVVTPLGWRERTADTSRLVNWLYSSSVSPAGESFNVHPLWWSGKSGDASHRVLAPLWFEFDSEKSRSVYTPLGWARREGDSESRVNWLYDSGREGKRSWLNIHPLWWSSAEGDRASELLLPLWWRRRNADREGVYTLLGMYERSGDEVMWGTIPFSSGRAGDRSWFNVHPFYWSYDAPDSSLRVVLPLWWSSREGADGAVYTPLGWRESSGEDFRWVTLPFSSGRSGSRSWLNIHPLWWSSSDPAGESSALLPLWSRTREKDGSGSLLTPLGFRSWTPAGDTDLTNILWLVYEWRREDATTEARHVLLPLWTSRRSSATVDGEKFVGTFALAASERAENVEAFRISPLWSSGRGSGVSPLRDWLHLVSRRERAGESSVTVTPLVESVSVGDMSRRRVTPLVSVADCGEDTVWREWTHLFSRRADEAGRSVTVTPLAAHREAGGDELWRITPLFRGGEGRFAAFSPWSPHLVTRDREPGRSAWSVTPLIGGLRTAESESARAWPFYWREARAGRTLDTGFFPFWSSSAGEGILLGGFCAWRTRDTGLEREDSFLGPVWSRRESRVAPKPATPIFAPGAAAVTSRATSLFTTAETGVAFRWAADGPDTPVCRRLALWLDEAPIIRLASDPNADPEMRRLQGESRLKACRDLHAEVIAILGRHGHAPADASPDAVDAAIRRLAEANTRTVPRERFAADPLWVDWWCSEREGDDGSWELLFGLAHGERRGGFSRVSVLSLLYAEETSPEGRRMNCFPFIRRDESKTSEKFSFLGRVWDRETDRATGAVRGHVLFIPW